MAETDAHDAIAHKRLLYSRTSKARWLKFAVLTTLDQSFYIQIAMIAPWYVSGLFNVNLLKLPPLVSQGDKNWVRFYLGEGASEMQKLLRTLGGPSLYPDW